MCQLRSNSTCYFAGTKTTGAGVDVGRLSADDRFDALHVGLECAVGAPMRVGDFDSKADFLSANFTFCHLLHLLLVIIVTTNILTNPILKCKCFLTSLVVFLPCCGYNEDTNRKICILFSLDGVILAEITYKLNEFEGPLDLLLHLIAKHKMQLFDIQIYQLIDQYLQFIGEIGPDQLEPTSEFVEMAARLVYMKSVALLPRSEEKEELEKELTGRLIEYSLCKLAAERLRDRSEGINFFIRQPLEIKLPNDYNRKHDPAVLLEALKSIHGRNKVMPDVERFEPLVSAPVVSVESRVIHILGSLRRNKGGVHISDFFANSSGRSETVATFLGILELIRNGRILVDDDGVVTNRESEVTSDA